MRRVQVACSLVVACGLVGVRAHSSHVAGTAHVRGLRRSAVRVGAVERFGRGSLPLLRLRGGSEQLFIETTSYPDLKPNPALESTIHLVFRLRGGEKLQEDAKPVQTRAASWSRMIHLWTRTYASTSLPSRMRISPEHVADAALAVFFFAVTIFLLHWADRRLCGDRGYGRVILMSHVPASTRYLFFLLLSPMLFFAGRVPPPFPAFVLCSSISFICGIAVGVLVSFSLQFSPGESFDHGPQGIAQCIITFISAFCFAGLLLLTTPFLVPTFGLALVEQ